MNPGLTTLPQSLLMQEKTMTYYYYKDSKGEWRLKAANGRIIADSGEGYSSEWSHQDTCQPFSISS
jgi:uncharacterized protein YegP (UPF0339 family)